MLVTFDREKSCLGHGKGWGELPGLYYYSIPAMKCQFQYVRKLNIDYLLQCGVYLVVRFSKYSKIKTVRSNKMLVISSNFLDITLYRKKQYP